uniref:AsIV-cont00010-ORF1 n=1 Tax=Apophua simplicipes ichnovirus TaxID=1329648 RepID=S5DSV7_9VIRU|nr:AsIV-cont00010-ORF1 [Apophua simplicipes ichnovirus]
MESPNDSSESETYVVDVVVHDDDQSSSERVRFVKKKGTMNITANKLGESTEKLTGPNVGGHYEISQNLSAPVIKAAEFVNANMRSDELPEYAPITSRPHVWRIVQDGRVNKRKTACAIFMQKVRDNTWGSVWFLRIVTFIFAAIFALLIIFLHVPAHHVHVLFHYKSE